MGSEREVTLFKKITVVSVFVVFFLLKILVVYLLCYVFFSLVRSVAYNKLSKKLIIFSVSYDFTLKLWLMLISFLNLKFFFLPFKIKSNKLQFLFGSKFNRIGDLFDFTLKN